MKLWTNEYEVPEELLALLDIPETPSELWKEIVKACDEVENQGAVTYPTKARVEFYIHKYSDLLTRLLGQ
jgi:hypothetical protein